MSIPAEQKPSPVTISTADLIALNQKCRGLSMKSGLISAIQSGDEQSAFKGRGMEYDESRLYQPGDDIRNIDWRVTARSGKVHTKLFREERERPVHLWVDLRRSMFFATRGKFKAVRSAELASMFAWIAINQGDRVGGIVFSDNIHHELKPQHGKLAVLRLIKRMVELSAWQQHGDYGSMHQDGLSSLPGLRRLVRPGSLVILLSDFRGFDEKARIHLLGLRQHNEIIMVHIYDPLEAMLPPAGYYRISDGNNNIYIDTGNHDLVEQHKQRFNAHRDKLLATVRSCHINFLSCLTCDEPETILREGLRQR